MSLTRCVVAVATAMILASAGAQAAGDRWEDEDAVPALAAVGVSAGFPSYQTIAPTLSLQWQHLGFQAKASWTAAGPYVGLQLRGYLPVAIPVPMYVGAGAGFYGKDVSYHAALGAHVPLSLNARLDLEGGIANVPLLNRRSWAPHLAAGVSYAFPVETSAGPRATSDSGRSQEPIASGCAASTEPDVGGLKGAVDRSVRDFIRSARATYGSIYTDLTYNYSVTGTSVEGDRAKVDVRYSGSVLEIATGQRHSASGTAAATFRWTGCSWVRTGLDY